MQQISLISKINSIKDVTKSLQEIEKVVNELIASTNSPGEGVVSDAEGKTGDIRITQNEDKDYIFEIRAEDGWKTPVIGNSAVIFKEKPSPSSKNQKKSIDELDNDDASTGGTEAQKTIFDEKANKFVAPRADYDSGWVQLDNNTTITLTHNLELDNIPSLMKSYVSTVESPVVGTNPIFECFQCNENNGFFIEVASSNTLKVHSGGTSTFDSANFGDLTDSDDIDDGYVRVLLWK